MSFRLITALEAGAVELPPNGEILLMRPKAERTLLDLDVERCRALHGFWPEVEALRRMGLLVSPTLECEPKAAVVFVDKAKGQTLHMIAQACAVMPEGAQVIVDGAKGEGVDSILKLCRKAFDVGEVTPKAHGKVFGFSAKPAPEGWMVETSRAGDYATAPGVFSADKLDPGSKLLMSVLPTLKGAICDLGAGWGFLSSEVLQRGDPVKSVDLVEAEWSAIEAARKNIDDPRAGFHWADARGWTGRYDWVISNPPFHIGRETVPELGQAFISQAAKLLSPRGTFVMVANSHLPYARTLEASFRETVVLAQENGYKITLAKGVKRG